VFRSVVENIQTNTQLDNHTQRNSPSQLADDKADIVLENIWCFNLSRCLFQSSAQRLKLHYFCATLLQKEGGLGALKATTMLFNSALAWCTTTCFYCIHCTLQTYQEVSTTPNSSRRCRIQQVQCQTGGISAQTNKPLLPLQIQ
jgi:hypothetical protein